MSQFQDVSYSMHSEDLDNPEKAEAWKDDDTVDYWRHARMYANIDPLLKHFPGASWLTVGDGRYGTDAHYIQEKGGRALATDIQVSSLQRALDEKYISEFKVENAEALTFEDDAFDFVFCKESYHHFPRPMVALYEMLRVARKGVILIEPQDANAVIPSEMTFLESMKWVGQAIKNRIKSTLGLNRHYHYGNYETSGNYVYTISRREIEKVALGLNLDFVAFNGLCDHYEDGAEFEKTKDNGPLLKIIKRMIAHQEKRAKQGLRPYGLMVALILKTQPEDELAKELKEFGFQLHQLSKNPYVAR